MDEPFEPIQICVMMTRGFLFFLLLFTFSGCITRQKCLKRYLPAESVETFVRHDTISVVKDSLILLSADSGLIRALLECREGKVAIMQIKQIKPGKKVVPFLYLRDNVLTTGARIDSSSVYFAWKETHTRDSRVQVKTIETTVNKVTGLQNFLIWSGWIAWFILIILIGIAFIRAYIKKRLLL